MYFLFTISLLGKYFDLITYKNILIDMPQSAILKSIKNSYAISHFPKLNRILLNGHMWQPSLSCSYDELIDIPVEP